MNDKEAVKLATRFHETYERLAPSFGYETRQDTKVFDPESKNGKLMVAVCQEIGSSLAISAIEENERLTKEVEELREACVHAHDILLWLHVCDKDKDAIGDLRAELKAVLARPDVKEI